MCSQGGPRCQVRGHEPFESVTQFIQVGIVQGPTGAGTHVRQSAIQCLKLREMVDFDHPQ